MGGVLVVGPSWYSGGGLVVGPSWYSGGGGVGSGAELV